MQKLWIKTKQIVIFFALWAIVTWFSAEIIFALFKNSMTISKDDLLGAASISFILVYAIIKPVASYYKLKLWIRYVLYSIIYTALFLLISFM
jgi:hypothetical protein